MLDLSVIILTYNEEIHIRRCIENIKSLAKDIFIVDSYSNDKTLEIAQDLGVLIYQNKWENNHAKQLNWALENLPIQTKWILRLDADEYLTEELKHEFTEKLSGIPEYISGIELKRRHIFLGKWIKRGTYPVKILRVFKNKKAICEQRLMDEHMVLKEGSVIEFENDFVDHNLNSINWWINKHNNYATKEAIELLDLEFQLFEKNEEFHLSKETQKKRNMKIAYAKKPLFIRSFLYFIYRYILKGGFIEGKEGFLWHFLQGWWYRTLVDAKIFEIKKFSGNTKQKILDHMKNNYNIDLN